MTALRMTRPRRFLLALFLLLLFTVNPWPAEGGLGVVPAVRGAGR